MSESKAIIRYTQLQKLEFIYSELENQIEFMEARLNEIAKLIDEERAGGLPSRTNTPHGKLS